MVTVKGAQMATFIRDAQNVIQRDGSHPDWNGEEVLVTIKMSVKYKRNLCSFVFRLAPGVL